MFDELRTNAQYFLSEVLHYLFEGLQQTLVVHLLNQSDIYFENGLEVRPYKLNSIAVVLEQ